MGDPERTTPGIAAGDILWVFAFPRSGTTWLASMLRDLPGHDTWNEPYVGAMVGEFYRRHNGDQQVGTGFILAPEYRYLWLDWLRSLVLESASARFPGRKLVVIKEPHGCIGAQFLSEALPESRFILMLRDPRDVIASNLDAQRRGSWTSADPRWKNRERPRSAADTDPDSFVASRTQEYMREMAVARAAYESHPGPKALVKYETLRADPLSEMLRMLSQLGVPVERPHVFRVVTRQAWENLPEGHKGPGSFYRSGTPGGWRQDLTDEQVRIVELGTHSMLEEFYPGLVDGTIR
jgi:hypothetical protein